MQAFNASGMLLSDHEYEVTIMWLIQQYHEKTIHDNPDIASNVLIAIAGQCLTNIRESSGKVPCF